MKWNSDDRISKLPEPILHHILSFLHAKDAARMSTLSKVLDSAWNSLPYLDFGDIFWWSKDLNVVMDQTLASRKKHKISMQRFSLWLLYYACLSYDDRWIKILIASCPWQSLLPSLNVLSLHGFNIELPADDEHLSLQYFNGLTSFQVGDTLPKLKKIDLVNLEPPDSFLQLVDIAAINLEKLSISNKFYGNINVALKTMKITSERLKQPRVVDCHNLIVVELDTPNLIKFHCFNEKFKVFLG
ncbi:hypothetical protein P3L10_018263 [Capsicum annuum]